MAEPQEAHSARAHSRFSPSAAARLIACPGSVRAEAMYPDRESSPDANLGTAAHELATVCLLEEVDPDDFLGRYVDTRTGKIERDGEADDVHVFEIDEDMTEAVAVYVDFVRSVLDREPDAEMQVEIRLDLTHIHPEMFGTSDAIIYGPESRTLYVLDYKHGKGVVVDVEGNKQLMTYALGAMKHAERTQRPIKRVVAGIIQPRAPSKQGPVKTTEVSFEQLDAHEAELRAAIRSSASDDAPFFAGPHCRFCRKNGDCETLRSAALDAARAEFDDGLLEAETPASMSPERVAEVMREVEIIKLWLKSVEEHANALAHSGVKIPGRKLVKKRAVRKFKDADQTVDVLVWLEGLRASDIYQPQKLKTPAQIEKLLPKDRRQAMADLVVKQSSGTVLVPDDDPRPEVKAMTAADEFADSDLD